MLNPVCTRVQCAVFDTDSQWPQSEQADAEVSACPCISRIMPCLAGLVILILSVSGHAFDCEWQLSWDRTGVSLTVGQGFYSSYGGTFTTLEEDYYVTKTTLSGSGATTLAKTHDMPRHSPSLISMCVCVYVCMYMYICIYVCVNTHTHAHTHTYIYIYMYICTHTHIWLHVWP